MAFNLFKTTIFTLLLSSFAFSNLFGKSIRTINLTEYTQMVSLIESNAPHLKVKLLEVHFEDMYSTTYFVTSEKGEYFWQVISKVILNRLPKYIKEACKALTGYETLCEGVYLAGSAFIKYTAGNLFEMSGKIWNSNVLGDTGVATLKAYSIDEAKNGQKAFALSAKENDFPWQNASIANFGW